MSTYQVRSLEEADQIIREHERKTKTTYALLRSTKNFGCVDVPGEVLLVLLVLSWCWVMGQVTGHGFQGFQESRGSERGVISWKGVVLVMLTDAVLVLGQGLQGFQGSVRGGRSSYGKAVNERCSGGAGDARLVLVLGQVMGQRSARGGSFHDKAVGERVGQRSVVVGADLVLTGSGAGVIGEAGVGDAGGEEDGDSLQPKPMVKKKKKAGRTHKVSCTATIIMKEVIYYPEFQLFEHSKNNRIAVARQLKDALKSKAPVQKDRIIYVTVPAMSDHFGHTVGLQQGGKRLFVKNDFYGHNEPGSSNRVYYPVKQEKLNVAQLARRMKVDEDDTEARAREVREILQSIMGLTYKVGQVK
ncbi:hypothetical protein E2C01_012432 [Portunus trituberculatus]|uniref:Uncharacterized protein n=1 Tax=Portunus trituberculatus TaxID=210409 RepID=A0A5B7DE74_PORTR|nr:hypothetical protein [Portunus trituberculatus]